MKIERVIARSFTLACKRKAPKQSRWTNGIATPFGLAMTVIIVMAGCVKSLQTTAAPGFAPGEKTLKIAILPLEKSDNGQDEVAQTFREELYANLQEGPFELVELARTNSALKKLGAGSPGQYRELLSNNPQSLQDALGADVVLDSKILSWSLTYLAIHSDVKLEVETWMVDLSTGKELMRVSKGVVRTSGITQVPTGFIAAGTAPIMGLSKSVQQKVIDQLAREMALVLSGKKLEDL